MNTYSIRMKVRMRPAMAAWRFVTVPRKYGEEIKKHFGKHAKGWGSLPVEATIGKTTWRTSIFPDKKSSSYLLPLKASVRKAENIQDDTTVTCALQVIAPARF